MSNKQDNTSIKPHHILWVSIFIIVLFLIDSILAILLLATLFLLFTFLHIVISIDGGEGLEEVPEWILQTKKYNPIIQGSILLRKTFNISRKKVMQLIDTVNKHVDKYFYNVINKKKDVK